MNNTCAIDTPTLHTTQTAGALRAALATMGQRAWSVAPHLRDDDPLPQFASGGDMSHHPAPLDAAALDIRRLLTRPIANPLLRARNRQLQTLDLEVTISIGLDWRTRWGGYWLATIQNQKPCQSCSPLPPIVRKFCSPPPWSRQRCCSAPARRTRSTLRSRRRCAAC